MTREPLLTVRELSKTFPDLKALDRVGLEVQGGEIVALVGQNGSGKSTLVKILAGVHSPDHGGTISSGPDGKTALHFIHQDLGLIEGLTTIENLDLDGASGRRAIGPIRPRRERRRAEALIADFGGSFDVTRPVGELSAAERSIVAFARALRDWENPHNVLILDEPTAALHGDEVGKLFVAVRRVAERGAGVVFISHRLDEVVELADRVIVLRDGRLVADARRGDFDQGRLVELITGSVVAPITRHELRGDGEPVLRIRGLRGPTIRGIDFDLRAGEVLGVSGVLGSGREHIAATLFGSAAGTVTELDVQGSPLRGRSPRAAIAAGMGYVPADRHRDGAVMTMSARENMTLPRLRPLRRFAGRLDRRAERREVSSWCERVGLRPPDPERPLELFSGGNQQKVVLAKWLRNQPKVLLLDEPTQGVDVGAKAGIYELIAEAAAGGAGVLVASSDAKELALICDRVLILFEGALRAEVGGSDLTEAQLVADGLGPAADHECFPKQDLEMNGNG
ncbi:MAG: sugar ABC transporter ATP-binding protein [Actinobacteria bacterium]|nr:sugar ABC transporter ATP-binding protein [Actinomycetota bacterium]